MRKKRPQSSSLYTAQSEFNFPLLARKNNTRPRAVDKTVSGRRSELRENNRSPPPDNYLRLKTSRESSAADDDDDSR